MGNSIYHGLEASLNKSFTHGLMVNTAYTYAHSIDMVRDNLFGGASASIVPNAYDIRGTNRASSDFDFRQRFSLSFVYEVPEIPALLASAKGSGGNVLRQVLRDWRLSSSTTAHTGRPFTIMANSNNGSLGNLGGLVSEYGNCIGTGDLSSSARTVDHWFNTADFTSPVNPSRLGSCGRNTMSGPGLSQVDINLTRTFNYFGENRRMELRWDMLNAFNNTHLGLPNGDVTSSQFGQITNLAGDPRSMQFALKIIF
jgi:hypothetical protein